MPYHRQLNCFLSPKPECTTPPTVHISFGMGFYLPCVSHGLPTRPCPADCAQWLPGYFGWKDCSEPQISDSHFTCSPSPHTSLPRINGKGEISSALFSSIQEINRVISYYNLICCLQALFFHSCNCNTDFYILLKHHKPFKNIISLSSAVTLLIIFMAIRTFYQVGIPLFNQTGSQLLDNEIGYFCVKKQCHTNILYTFFLFFTTSLRYIPRNFLRMLKNKIKFNVSFVPRVKSTWILSWTCGIK